MLTVSLLSSSEPTLTSTLSTITPPIILVPVRAPSRRMGPSPPTPLCPRQTATSPPMRPWPSQTGQQPCREPCHPRHPAERGLWRARRTCWRAVRGGRGRGFFSPDRVRWRRWSLGDMVTPLHRPGVQRTVMGWPWWLSRSWTTTPRRTRSGGGSVVWSSASVFYKYQNSPQLTPFGIQLKFPPFEHRPKLSSTITFRLLSFYSSLVLLDNSAWE